MTSQNHIAVIGAGFAGLAAATTLASKGHKVTLLEKNEQAGGRARQFKAQGFVFDMGPSWYWMPETFEKYFNRFGRSVKDFYDLKRLDPSYRVFFETSQIEIPASLDELYDLFDSIDPGSASRLRRFLKDAEYKYTVGMEEFVWKPSYSPLDFADLRVFKSLFRMGMLKSISAEVSKVTKNDKLRQILEFPVLFLGAKPSKTPALYSMMNYADLALGTWYPMGGMHEIVKAMVATAEEQGVDIRTNAEVTRIKVEKGGAKSLTVAGDEELKCDAIIATGDYHHIDSALLAPAQRNYSETYWDNRTMAPSALLYYMGIDRKLKGLKHHNLFFDRDFNQHAEEIYEQPQWPSEPLFYICCPSITDPSVAPDGAENIFILIPIAPGMKGDTEEMRDKYLEVVRQRVIKHTGEDIKQDLIYERSYSVSEFKADYHAYKGNAYGLANTLRQTAFLKPKIKNKHVRNLFYAGQLTVPGPGVPPSLVSGQLVADEVNKYLT